GTEGSAAHAPDAHSAPAVADRRTRARDRWRPTPAIRIASPSKRSEQATAVSWRYLLGLRQQRHELLFPDLHRDRRDVFLDDLAVRADQECFGRAIDAPVDGHAAFAVERAHHIRIA